MFTKSLIYIVGVGGAILIKKVYDILVGDNEEEEVIQSGTNRPPPPPPSFSSSKPSSSSSPPYPKPAPPPPPSSPKPRSSFSPWPPPLPSSSKPGSSFSTQPPPPSSSKPGSSFSTRPPPPSSSKPGSSYSSPPPPSSSKPGSSFSPRPPPTPSQPSYPKPISSFFLPPPSPSHPKPISSFSPPPPSPSYPKPISSFSPPPPRPSPSPPSYPKPGGSSSSTKLTLFSAPPSSISKNHEQNKTNYIWVDKGTPTPIYVIPDHIKRLLEKDIVPDILKKPLSPSTYKDYFDTLLYADDYYLEKWDGFEMKSVTLELHEASIYSRKGKSKNINVNNQKDDKIFVAFEINKIPEKLPFLLSRDFASARPSGSKVEPFKGIIYRVLRSNLVLVEFGEDFHSQHYSGSKYDVKFSFNRVCLKRAHQAIAAASDPLLHNFIFPDCVTKNRSRPLSIDHILDRKQVSVVHQMLSIQGPPPYLVEGPTMSVTTSNGIKQLSSTGRVVKEAVFQIYRTLPVCRILICAPTNSTCDVLMRSLRKEIPESSMFRANAAFRELDGVPLDILPSCHYERECFSVPSLQQLQEFKVILSTFMSSFRLKNEGIMAGHFSHIFLVDASSATEPETMVALANLANERTTVVITGAQNNHPGLLHSSIARQNGLMTSYFERLKESKLYTSLDPRFITILAD